MRVFILVMTFVIVIILVTIFSYLVPWGLEYLLGLGVLFLLVYFWWGSNNLFFTFVNEGTCKVVVRGGEVRKILIQWRGYTLSRERDRKWDVVEGEERHILGGFRFYGLYPIDDIYVYKFSWTGITHDGKLKHHKEETLDYIMVKEDIYWGGVEKAEDKDLLPLDLELLFTIWVRNPYKALFRVDDWLQTVINRSGPAARNFVTKKVFKNLIGMTADVGDKIYKDLKERKIIEDEFLGRYGVEVRKIEVKDINPPEDYRKATLAKFEAARERERIKIGAMAESFRLDKVYGMIKEFGDLGRLVRTLEAVEKSPLAASITVQAIPGIQEVFRGIFGKAPEEATREEIRKLREAVEKIQRIRRR